MLKLYISAKLALLLPSCEKMQLLQNYCKNFCKILQENASTLANSCKILQDMFGSCKNFAKTYHSCKIFPRVVFSFDESLPQWLYYCTKIIRYLRFLDLCIPLQKCTTNHTVASAPRFSRLFRKRQK